MRESRADLEFPFRANSLVRQGFECMTPSRLTSQAGVLRRSISATHQPRLRALAETGPTLAHLSPQPPSQVVTLRRCRGRYGRSVIIRRRVAARWGRSTSTTSSGSSASGSRNTSTTAASSAPTSPPASLVGPCPLPYLFSLLLLEHHCFTERDCFPLVVSTQHGQIIAIMDKSSPIAMTRVALSPFHTGHISTVCDAVSIPASQWW